MTELSPYQRDLRDRLSSVPVLPAPAPWQPVFEPCAAVGGLLGIGFAMHPDARDRRQQGAHRRAVRRWAPLHR
ncbi:hypothetical protein [Streptomyces canus]|uniref:hypothetical protein n=1 Tax=Streptomyces canus TaxID=58343 RepID=UPI0038707201